MKIDIILNLYYQPPKALEDLIRHNANLYVPINSGNLAVPVKSEFSRKHVRFEDEMKDNIAHYVTKSKEECVERRSRTRADTNAARSDFEGFWNEHNVNEVDNFDVVRFAGGPKKRDCCETNK